MPARDRPPPEPIPTPVRPPTGPLQPPADRVLRHHLREAALRLARATEVWEHAWLEGGMSRSALAHNPALKSVKIANLGR